MFPASHDLCASLQEFQPTFWIRSNFGNKKTDGLEAQTQAHSGLFTYPLLTGQTSKIPKEQEAQKDLLDKKQPSSIEGGPDPFLFAL
jgi:hypothetical protein